MTVESGAGIEAGFADAAYIEAGARITPALPLAAVDVLCHVAPLDPSTVAELQRRRDHGRFRLPRHRAQTPYARWRRAA